MRGAFDFETYQWVNALCCGLVWGPPGKRDTRFIHDTKHKNPESVAEQALLEMLALVDDVPEWYAHNMGRYDGLFLIAAAIRLGWEIRGTLAGGGRVIGLTFINPKLPLTPLKVYDSYNLCARPLKECVTAFELPSRKLFSESDYSIDARQWPVIKLKEGCLADGVLVLELLEKLETLAEDWGGSLKYTFASTSMSIMKARLAAEGVTIPFLGAELNEEISRGYYGARVEVFHHTPSYDIAEYDINSAYPYSMAQELPWEYVGRLDAAKPIETLLTKRPMMVEAKVTVPKMHLPPLPFVIPDNEMSGLFFPTGTWQAIFTSEELLYARKLGVRVNPIRAWVFNWATPLRDFVLEVYKTKSTAKAEGKIALSNFAKDVLNAGYGKFGESPEHETLRVFANASEAVDYAAEMASKCRTRKGTSGVRFVWEEDPRILSITNLSWSKHSHYAVAAFITSRTRCNLHRFLAQTANPTYCDSDSIHCESWPGLPSTELGALKLERSGVRGEYFAPKIYRLSDPKKHLEVTPDCKDCHKSKNPVPCGIKLACKGFPVTLESFEKMIQGEGVQVERMRLVKSQLGKSALQRKDIDQVKRLSQRKFWAGRSLKRKALPDGSTRPWSVAELLSGTHEGQLSPHAGWAATPF